MASPRALMKFERMFQCEQDPDQATIEMLAASEKCTPFTVKTWFAQRRQNGPGEPTALELVQIAQQQRIARLGSQDAAGSSAQRAATATIIPAEPEPEPEPEPKPDIARLDLDPVLEIEVLSPHAAITSDTPTGRQLRKLEERWEKAARHTAAASEAAFLRIGSPTVGSSGSVPTSPPGSHTAAVRHTSSAPATLGARTDTQDVNSTQLAGKVAEHMNLSAFWAVHAIDRLAWGNLVAAIRQSAPQVSKFGAASQQLFGVDAAYQSRVSKLVNVPRVDVLRSRLCGLVTLLDQSMFHLSSASYAEFEGDFGVKGRVEWGSSPTSAGMHTISAKEVNAQWELDVSVEAQVQQQQEVVTSSEDKVEVMSADDLLLRLKLFQQPTRGGVCPSAYDAHNQGLVDAASNDRSPPAVLLPDSPALLLVRCMPPKGVAPPPRLLSAVSATLRIPEPTTETKAQVGEVEVVGGYKVGDCCEIFSHSAQAWCPGEVKAVRTHNSTLHVVYLPPGAGEGGDRSKMMKADSDMLRRRADQRNPCDKSVQMTEPWIEWSPKSEYLLGKMGEVLVYDAHGAGVREGTMAGVPVAARTGSGSKQPSLLIALAQALLARGASKVWVLGGGAAAVIRRCEILQASIFTRRCVEFSDSSPKAGAASGISTDILNRTEKSCYTDWMMSYRASLEEIEPGFLFLGNIKARDPDLLDGLGIRYVLNAANADLDEIAPLPEQRFKVFTLNLLDGTQLSADDGRLCDGLAFIDEAKQCGAKVLVHCALGANRSATLLLAWMLTRTQTTLAAAFRRTWRKRPCIAPWPQNARFLLDLEASREVQVFAVGNAGSGPTESNPQPEPEPEPALRQPSLWLWQLDPEMLKEADMLEWLARRLHAGKSLPIAD